jgi:hypothetical protein
VVSLNAVPGCSEWERFDPEITLGGRKASVGQHEGKLRGKKKKKPHVNPLSLFSLFFFISVCECESCLMAKDAHSCAEKLVS